MEPQNFFNLIASGGLAVLGWFARQLWDAIQKLKDDLASLREELAKEYVSRGDFKEVVGEIKALLERIDGKLDSKVDK